MENIFDAVWRALNINHVDFDDLAGAIDEIHQSYSVKSINTKRATCIDYSQHIFRWAYVYLYTTSHTHIISDLLSTFWNEHRVVRRCFENRQKVLKVCSVGGGPGNDVFGVNLFMERHVERENIQGNILDCYPSWEDTFDDLLSTLDVRNLNKVCHTFYDFFAEDNDGDVTDALAGADLVIIVKFISAVGFNRRYAENKLKNLLDQIKHDALVLFVDNSGGGYLELMNRAATRANLTNIEEIEKQDFEIPWKERLVMERKLPASLKPPQRTAAIAASIWHNDFIPHSATISRSYPYQNSFIVPIAQPRFYQSEIVDTADYFRTTRYNSDIEDNVEENNSFRCVIL